jgi:glycosyltransferase involved in cell wall biosynthesis
MVGYLGMPGVGVVGARLRFPDGRLQHAGVVHGYYHSLAGPAFKLAPASEPGYLGYAMVARNYAAVTAACLLTPRALFVALGGFDAKSFAVAYNDVDYCARVRAEGHRVVYCPTAELIHREGTSRGFREDPAEPAAFRRRHGGSRDPYYSPHLSLAHERLAVEARTLAPPRLAPVRALMCAFTLNWEGAPYSQFELTARLKADGVLDPVVYCPQDGPLRAAYEERGIRVEVFEHPLRRVRDRAAYEAAVARFAEFVAASGVEVVYGNTRQTFYAIDAARRAGQPSIWNLRESEPWESYFDYLAPDLPARAVACLDYPYRVVFVSDATRRACAALERRHNFVTIRNGLDRQRFAAMLAPWPRAAARSALGVASGEVVLLSLGTVCPRKAQRDLVEAVARLDAEAAGRLRCFIVGDRPGPYSEQLREAWRALPADRRARVAIVAETPETGTYYAAADVFVCTSSRPWPRGCPS